MDERYSIRGIEPVDYSGYFDFAELVRAKAIADQMPDLRADDSPSPGLVTLKVAKSAALRLWEVRLLSVQIGTDASDGQNIGVRLDWPSETDAVRDTYPFAAIRQAFERSNLHPDSREWVTQRNRMWPEVSKTAREIAWSGQTIDVRACPKLVEDLRQIRDAPPPLEIIPKSVELGDKGSDRVVLIADGWELAFAWNGGPDQYDGGRMNPDQGSPLGRALLGLMGDAEACAGLD